MTVPAPKYAEHIMDAVQRDGAKQTWQRLESGEIGAFYDDRDGQRQHVDPARWRGTAYTAEKVARGTEITSWHPVQLLARGDLSWITDRPVYIPSVEAEDVLGAIGPVPAAPDRAQDLQSQPKSRTQSTPVPRGRGFAYDWEAAIIEMGRIVLDDGPPKSQAELVRKIADWFVVRGDEEPSESSIKARTKMVFEAWRLRQE